jgi:phage terminase large subunit GpA-like protein
MRLWNIGLNMTKGELYSWLQQEIPAEGEPFPTGWCTFPEYEEEHFKQMTGERRVMKLVRGYRRYIWEQHYPHVEVLDCRVYGRAAAAIVGIDRWREEQWVELEQQLAIREPDGKDPQVVSERHGVKLKKSKYWDKSR